VSRRGASSNPARVKAQVAALSPDAPEAADGDREIARRPTLLLLCLLSMALLTVGFAPFDQAWLAYVALVPWSLAVVGARVGRKLLLWVYLAGVAFWAAGLYWLTWMAVAGYVPLVLYLGLYFLVPAPIIRRAFRRGVPLWLALPATVVALEYARAYALSGFPWFYLAHTQYRWVRLIQVCDLTGVYGVSFFVLMVNGAVADALAWAVLVRDPAGRRRLRKRTLIGAGACAAAAAGMLVYGTWRIGQRTTSPGPAVGVVQMAFPISLYRAGAPPEEVFRKHLHNTAPLTDAGCNIIAWPESMLGFPNMTPAWLGLDPAARDPADPSRPRYTPEQQEAIEQYQEHLRALSALIAEAGCPLLAGGGMRQTAPDGREVRTNSVLLFDRDDRGRLRLRGRYDKMHLVPFSEYVPFREGWPALHRLLRRFVPEVMPQLDPGQAPVRMEVTAGGRRFRFAAPICYEGTFARVCRELVMEGGRKRADLLINLSNDGWFIYEGVDPPHAGTELDQHLVQYVFRAVENRVPVVRAVNTGISAHVDSNGTIREVVSHLGRRKMVAGRLVARTLVDDRVSVYSRVGDVFAVAVSAAAAGLAIGVFRPRRPKVEGKARKGRHGKK